MAIFPGSKTSQSDVEAFHRLVKDEFLEVEDYQTNAQPLGRSRIYQCYFDHHRRLVCKGGKTPAQIFAQMQSQDCHPGASPVAFTLPPIVLDDLERFLRPAGYHVPVMVTERQLPD